MVLMLDNELLRFKLIIHESNGTVFEKFFKKIMTSHNPEFKPVKPYGKIGDRGNDGWYCDNGEYYQCYAPENIQINIKNAIKKLKDDFKKLYDYWNPISSVKKYYFVINDKFEGIAPPISKAVAEIKKEYSLIDAKVMDAKDLECIFRDLPFEKRMSILGHFNPRDYETERYLVECIIEKMNLKYWANTSHNLLRYRIKDSVLENFKSVVYQIESTDMPGRFKSLDASIQAVAEHLRGLCAQFCTKHVTCIPNPDEWWRDMSWKAIQVSQEEFDKKYDDYSCWAKELFRLHWNLVYALNLFLKEVRQYINPDCLKRQNVYINNEGNYFRYDEHIFPYKYSDDWHDFFTDELFL